VPVCVRTPTPDPRGTTGTPGAAPPSPAARRPGFRPPGRRGRGRRAQFTQRAGARPAPVTGCGAMDPRGGTPRAVSPRRLRPAVAAAVCAAALLAGCRNSDGFLGRKSGPEGALASRDPLLGGTRIPPQNLPVPGKDGYGARERRDPLL